MTDTRPRHSGGEAQKRWTFEERERLLTALRWFMAKCGSCPNCDEALGLGRGVTARTLTSADEIAKGTWKPGAAA